MKTKTKKGGAAATKKGTKFKKSPDAPKRFKSAFIIFSSEKHKEIKSSLQEEGRSIRTTEIAKMVSESWKSLSPEERKEWDDKAEKDKARYEAEKAMYKGPWKIPSNKRKTKDPSAPKRPMSAFLAYSNKRRAALKREHPKSTNADLSRMLSKSWKELEPNEREVYMVEERKLRDQYKKHMAEWRSKVAKEKQAEREEREVAALQAAQAGSTQESSDVDASRSMANNKWKGLGLQQNQSSDNIQQQQQDQQQQQMNDMAANNMFGGNWLQQAAAFGGGGMGQAMDPRAAALGFNPAAANPYLQGFMQGPGNPGLSLFGAQSYMQNAGMSGQIPSGLYGNNLNMGGMNDSAAGGAAAFGNMQS